MQRWLTLATPATVEVLYWLQLILFAATPVCCILVCLFFSLCVCKGRGYLGRRGYGRWLWSTDAARQEDHDDDVIEASSSSTNGSYLRQHQPTTLSLTGGYATSMPQMLDELHLMPDPQKKRGCCFDDSSDEEEEDDDGDHSE